jgi:hypothetical protein
MPAMPRAAPPMMPAETTERAKARAMLLVISEFSCVSKLFGFRAGVFSAMTQQCLRRRPLYVR